MQIPRLALIVASNAALAAPPPEPKFHAVTIDPAIQIGYGVAVADIDGDGKPDVLLADKKQIVWYRNPGAEKAAEPGAWTKYVIAENLTEHDNVCLAAQDLDGDGKCELAVGAEWNPSDTEKSGAVFYLIPPADRTQRWEPVKFPSVEPTTHRMKWVMLYSGKPGNSEFTSDPEKKPASAANRIPDDIVKWGLVVVPLHGRGNKNGEGAPVKVLCYHKPADVRGEWKTTIVDESMHMTHNFTVLSHYEGRTPPTLIIGGREGLSRALYGNGKWMRESKDLVAPSLEIAFAGVGEVRCGRSGLVATVEPMHGNSLVAYVDESRSDYTEQSRHVLTDQLTEGHALACGDVLGTGNDQIIVGWRGNPQKPRPVGIKLFTPLDDKVEQWRESLIDDNEMACEDLVLADLNGDGKLDVVASGRSTHNVKIYLNETGR